MRNGGLRVLQPALGCRHPEEPPTPNGAAGRRPGIEALPALALRVGRRKGEVEGWLLWAVGAESLQKIRSQISSNNPPAHYAAKQLSKANSSPIWVVNFYLFSAALKYGLPEL